MWKRRILAMLIMGVMLTAGTGVDCDGDESDCEFLCFGDDDSDCEFFCFGDDDED